MPAASILPVSFYKNKLYFLFGKENPMEDSSKGFSDFGGGCEAGESFFQTALREGSEELSGFLGTKEALAKHIRKNGGAHVIRFQPNTKMEYRVHLVFVEYSPELAEYYNNNHAFLWNRMNKRVLNDSKLFEKIQIEWFCEDELEKRMPEYRAFYRDVVRMICADIPRIRKFVKNQNRKSSKTHNKNVRMRRTRRIKGG
jgi:hypothetical protein